MKNLGDNNIKVTIINTDLSHQNTFTFQLRRGTKLPTFCTRFKSNKETFERVFITKLKGAFKAIEYYP